MRFLSKSVVFLLLLGALALIGYAAFFDLPSPQREVVVPVEAQ